MKFNMIRHAHADGFEFSGSISDADLAKLKLSRHDLALMRREDTPANCLEKLAMLFRRAEEQKS